MNRRPVWLLLLVFLVVPFQSVFGDCLYGLVLDKSGSMRPVVDQALTGARVLVEKAGARDRFFLITFADETTLEQETTGQKQEIVSALDNLVVHGHPSAVLDAVFLSAREIHERVKPTESSALVLITDGDEEASHTKLDDVLRRLRENQVQVFAIGFPHIIPKQKGKKAQKKAAELLERLAKSTGGGAWFPQSEAEVATAVDEILKRVKQ